MATRARDRLIRTAMELFSDVGIQAVGVERLLDASGVGRASFYRHFGSKDDLVAAALRERSLGWRTWLGEQVAARGGEPLAVFDVLREDCAGSAFRGCTFNNAAAEFTDPDCLVRRLVREHKDAVAAFLAGLVRDAGYADEGPEADALGADLLLLMDGATVTAAREHSPEPVDRARNVAARLLAAADASERPYVHGLA
ncbi:TetR/AcrR family transcriptional regulator [Streptomyces albiaxialis]|uniref:TetR/AcrR family transcriptional regulator n=1 Tax=Streptomyces albiaxialis TaxID=329523 RepID=A0ABN2WP46_9ACTN